MTAPIQENQAETAKVSNKEFNFRNLEASYQRELEKERGARLEVERQLQERSQAPVQEEDDSEPYVNKQNLNRQFTSFEKKMEEKIEKKAEEKARAMIYGDKKDTFLKNNADFYDVLQHADKLAQRDPELAESILDMPESFERQKLVYKNIKALGLHQPAVKQPTIQEKVDSNRKGPYYQPSGVGTAPYASQGDYSAGGQKQAYDKMKELQNRLRL